MASCYLAKTGYHVEVFEKNSSIGGRAEQRKKNGFKFDTDPTWYWMPDIFERFFADFNKKPSDFYELQKLSRKSGLFLSSTNRHYSRKETWKIFIRIAFCTFQIF